MLEEERFGLTQLWVQPEFEGEQPDKVVCAKNGIIQVNATDMAAPLGFESRPYQRRLARSGLSD